jgi:hypothetical protein
VEQPQRSTGSRAPALFAFALGCAFAVPTLGGASVESTPLTHAALIRAELNATYRRLPGRQLVVTEASSTDVVESFTLLSPNLQDSRTISAESGVWYSVCLARATCPYPRPQDGRPASAYLPRQLALDLAIRTFHETSAQLVAVSLPTPRFFTVFLLTRDELRKDPNLLTLVLGARRDVNASERWSRDRVDRAKRSRVFVFVALEKSPTGETSFAAMPRWPDLGAQE